MSNNFEIDSIKHFLNTYESGKSVDNYNANEMNANQVTDGLNSSSDPFQTPVVMRNKGSADSCAFADHIISPNDVESEVFDWIFYHLEYKKCPYSLAIALASIVSRKLGLNETTLHDSQDCNTDNSKPALSSNELYSQSLEYITEYINSWKENPEIAFEVAKDYSNKAFSTSINAIKNTRRKMEDRHVIIHDLNKALNLKVSKQYSYYAIFDGHAGVDAASYAAAHIHHNLVKSQAFLDGDIADAFREAFSVTDLHYLERSAREGKKSGSTALCALLEDKCKLFLAWLGDSQAMLVRNGKPIDVMVPHKPEREDERKRIEDLGGFVAFVDTWRVSGTLAVSRAIGDPEHKPYISSEPDVTEINITPEDDFFVLACDGLWDQLTPEEATTLVYQYICENEDKNTQELEEGIAKYLSSIAREEGSSDNITTIVIFFKDLSQLRATPFTPLTPRERSLTNEMPTNGQLNGFQRNNCDFETVQSNTNPFDSSTAQSMSWNSSSAFDIMNNANANIEVSESINSENNNDSRDVSNPFTDYTQQTDNPFGTVECNADTQSSELNQNSLSAQHFVSPLELTDKQNNYSNESYLQSFSLADNSNANAFQTQTESRLIGSNFSDFSTSFASNQSSILDPKLSSTPLPSQIQYFEHSVNCLTQENTVQTNDMDFNVDEESNLVQTSDDIVSASESNQDIDNQNHNIVSEFEATQNLDNDKTPNKPEPGIEQLLDDVYQAEQSIQPIGSDLSDISIANRQLLLSDKDLSCNSLQTLTQQNENSFYYSINESTVDSENMESDQDYDSNSMLINDNFGAISQPIGNLVTEEQNNNFDFENESQKEIVTHIEQHSEPFASEPVVEYIEPERIELKSDLNTLSDDSVGDASDTIEIDSHQTESLPQTQSELLNVELNLNTDNENLDEFINMENMNDSKDVSNSLIDCMQQTQDLEPEAVESIAGPILSEMMIDSTPAQQLINPSELIDNQNEYESDIQSSFANESDGNEIQTQIERDFIDSNFADISSSFASNDMSIMDQNPSTSPLPTHSQPIEDSFNNSIQEIYINTEGMDANETQISNLIEPNVDIIVESEPIESLENQTQSKIENHLIDDISEMEQYSQPIVNETVVESSQINLEDIESKTEQISLSDTSVINTFDTIQTESPKAEDLPQIQNESTDIEKVETTKVETTDAKASKVLAKNLTTKTSTNKSLVNKTRVGVEEKAAPKTMSPKSTVPLRPKATTTSSSTRPALKVNNITAVKVGTTSRPLESRVSASRLNSAKTLSSKSDTAKPLESTGSKTITTSAKTSTASSLTRTSRLLATKTSTTTTRPTSSVSSTTTRTTSSSTTRKPIGSSSTSATTRTTSSSARTVSASVPSSTARLASVSLSRKPAVSSTLQSKPKPTTAPLNGRPMTARPQTSSLRSITSKIDTGKASTSVANKASAEKKAVTKPTALQNKTGTKPVAVKSDKKAESTPTATTTTTNGFSPIVSKHNNSLNVAKPLKQELEDADLLSHPINNSNETRNSTSNGLDHNYQ